MTTRHPRRESRRRWLATLAILVVATTALLSGAQTIAAPVGVTVNAEAELGTLRTRLSTQIKYPGSLEAPGTRQLFRGFGAPLVRVLTSGDGCCWAGGPRPMIPAWFAKEDWDFSSLDSVVNDVTAAGAGTVLTILQAPAWMWNCTTGTISDLSFGEFADYMARLVQYYNRGSFVAEDGRTITNPAGVANRITYWELWNEPELPAISCQPNGNPNITAAQYLAMWNATVPKMRAVDPAIKFVGPGTDARDYVGGLLAGAVRRPDVVSFHGYGGWLNTQSDQVLFDSLDHMVNSLVWGRMSTPAPIWFTELNVQAAYEDDPAHRPYNAYGVAWGASAFRRLALGGADAIFQYEFAHTGNANFQMVDFVTGQPRLPYWRDYYLARYFPPGSRILFSRSSLDGVETLAARAPGSHDVHVLIVNRQVDGPTTVGGRGLPATVQVNVRELEDVSRVSLRMFDDSTPLASGPPAVPLPARNSATVTFDGYGAAMLTFATASDHDEDEGHGRRDRQPPSAPSGLTATATSESRIDLTWTASTDNVGVTSYLVERCAGPGCSSFTQVGTAAAASYSDGGLPAAATFAYRVRATDAANNVSGYSNVAGGTTQPARGLVAAYPFDEGAGATTADVSGRGHTGSLTDATWTVDGKYGNALAFNGTTSYVDLGNASDLQITGSMSWSAWIFATADPGDDGQIIAKSLSAGAAWRPYGWHFKTSPDTGPHTFGVGVSPDGLTLTQRYSTTVRALNTWYHVAGVYDAAAQTLDIYVNGTLDDGVLRGSVPAAQFNSPASVNIGRHGGGFYFQGTIDDVRLYDRALTPAEIQSDMNTPLGTTASSR